MGLPLLKASLAVSLLLAPLAGDTAVAPGRASTPARAGAGARAGAAPAEGGSRPHSFYFSRAAYSGTRGGSAAAGAAPGTADPRAAWAASRACGGGFCAWATDYPKAERQFLTVLRRLTNLDASPAESAVRLDAPDLRRFPFIYAVEVGYMDLTDAEVQGLRDYLLAGGLLVADDFWGTQEWRNFEAQMQRVLPGHPFVDLPPDHPLFSAFYDIGEIVQVPNLAQGVMGGPTHERDGFVPHVRGIFDPAGRLLVIANWNTDLGDAWEWAEQPRYPLRFSTFAYQLGVNIVVYAMSH